MHPLKWWVVEFGRNRRPVLIEIASTLGSGCAPVIEPSPSTASVCCSRASAWQETRLTSPEHELIRRIHADLADSYDEELELELDDRTVDDIAGGQSLPDDDY